MSFIVIIIIGVVLFILFVIVVATIYSSHVKEIDKNVERIKILIDERMDELNKEGISSIKKNYFASKALPKNEIVYGQYVGTIHFRRNLASGVKITTAGYGDIIISDKAITIESTLKSGKRRFFFKNMSPYTIQRKRYEIVLSIIYNQKELLIPLDPQKLKIFLLVPYLIKNPMKSENAISF